VAKTSYAFGAPTYNVGATHRIKEGSQDHGPLVFVACCKRHVPNPRFRIDPV